MARLGEAYTLLLWEFSRDGRQSGIDYEVFKNNLIDEYKIDETQLNSLAGELLARYSKETR